MKNILLIDFGSTYTKLTAVDIDSETILGTAAAYTTVETDINDGVRVKSDAEMMSLVWNNLFSNAIKFTEEGGCIFLSIQEDETYAIIKIKDTGCGISKVVGKRIFDKFYQGDTSHATQGNGLALVKRVIDIMEGDISVESELGKGTTFTVKIRKSGGK